jgi:hypothetical protein
MNVVFLVDGEIIIYDKRHLLDIDTTSQQISGDQHTGRSSSKFLHNAFTVLLFHVSVEGRDGKVFAGEFLGEPVYFATGVAKDYGLGDGDCVVQVAQCIEFPFFLFNSNGELLDTYAS